MFGNRKLLIGTSLLLIIIFTSFLFPMVVQEPPATEFRYDASGKLSGIPPYGPSSENWLGTDRNGKDLFYALVEGAKYTVIFAIIITFGRLFLSLVAALFFRRLFINRWSGGLMHAFQYFPQSILALILLAPLMFYEVRSESDLTYPETLAVQLIVLVAAGFFPLAKILAETMDSLSRFEYVTCAKHLGASPLHITLSHIFPHLMPRLFVLAGRQFTQVLTLMLHLAIFHFFIGGVRITSGQEHDQFLNYTTLSNEWTGLIGQYHRELMLEPYIVMFPVMAYAFLILCANMMTAGFEKNFSKKRRMTSEY